MHANVLRNNEPMPKGAQTVERRAELREGLVSSRRIPLLLLMMMLLLLFFAFAFASAFACDTHFAVDIASTFSFAFASIFFFCF